MAGKNASQVQAKVICDVLDVKAVVYGINDKGLVAGDAAGVNLCGRSSTAALCQTQLL